MRVLIVKNCSDEGPGTLGLFLKDKQHDLTMIDLQKGQPFPPDYHEYSLIILLGGPMNVYEENQYPYLKSELKFIDLCLKSGIKIMGICLGAQMISRALGAIVKKNPKKEIGWFDLQLLAPEGDLIFNSVPRQFPVFQWHGDTFDIPNGATHLAKSSLCQNQAYFYQNALALQFHIEINGESEVNTWSGIYLEELIETRGQNALHEIIQETKNCMPVLKPIAKQLYQNIINWTCA